MVKGEQIIEESLLFMPCLVNYQMTFFQKGNTVNIENLNSHIIFLEYQS